MLKEIEVKASVSDKAKLLKSLRALGCKLTAPITQKDQVFIPKDVVYPVPLGTIVLRIRQQADATIFTLKQALSNELDCIEKELWISNKKKMQDIVELLGFYQALRINKTRRKTRYKNYEICLDDVEELGSFIEVEEISERNTRQVQKELFTFLESLGVKRSDRVLQGYDTLLYNKNR